MPFRRRPKLLAEIPAFDGLTDIEKLGRVAPVILAIELLIERMWSLLRLLAFVVLVMAVAYVVQAYQLQQRNRALREIRRSAAETIVASDRARVASEKASADLSAAINAASGTQLDPRIAHALAQIDCLAHHREPCP